MRILVFGKGSTAWRNREEQAICAVPCGVRKGRMDSRKIFNWLIALIVAAGLVAAPLSAPALAALHPASSADGMRSMGDMPCCPDQQDQKAKDRGSCPFIALCMMTMTMPAPNNVGTLASRDFSRSKVTLPNDLMIDGLGEQPPDHPPRMIV
jgi:hypothetical protein